MKSAPSFVGFTSSSPRASAVMRANRREGGRAETLLRKAMRANGLRFRVHVRELPGVPDAVFPHARVCVFCDGDFWHGRHWIDLRRALATRANSRYWLAKIEANRRRDRRQVRQLRAAGWRVVRLWERDILKNPEAAVRRVVRYVDGPIVD